MSVSRAFTIARLTSFALILTTGPGMFVKAQPTQSLNAPLDLWERPSVMVSRPPVLPITPSKAIDVLISTSAPTARVTVYFSYRRYKLKKLYFELIVVDDHLTYKRKTQINHCIQKSLIRIYVLDKNKKKRHFEINAAGDHIT